MHEAEEATVSSFSHLNDNQSVQGHGGSEISGHTLDGVPTQTQTHTLHHTLRTILESASIQTVGES